MSTFDTKNGRVDEEKGLLVSRKNPLDRLSANDATIDWKKYASLVWICVQNCAHILLVKYTRVTQGCNHYSVSLVVLLSEIIKLLTCYVICACYEGSASRQYIRDWKTLMVLMVPSVCFTVQNNIQFVVIDHMDVGSIVVLNQLKTLFTAITGIVIIGRKLNIRQWFALFCIMFGVAISQLNNFRGVSADRIYIGLSVLQSMCSAFAAVYLEKILKGDSTPLYARNMQLSTLCLPLQVLTIYINEPDTWRLLREWRAFDYFCTSTWILGFMFAYGGISVSIVMRFADNNLKNLAMAASIVGSSTLSVPLFGNVLSNNFLVGVCAVLVGVLTYGC